MILSVVFEEGTNVYKGLACTSGDGARLAWCDTGDFGADQFLIISHLERKGLAMMVVGNSDYIEFDHRVNVGEILLPTSPIAQEVAGAYEFMAKKEGLTVEQYKKNVENIVHAMGTGARADFVVYALANNMSVFEAADTLCALAIERRNEREDSKR